MEQNLFSSLKKYRPRENKDSVENYITQTFCWILRNTSFSAFFLKKLGQKLETEFVFTTCEWNTQANFNGFYPDMVCRFDDGDKAIVFEHKAWKHLHYNQLENYRNYAKNQFSTYHLVLITANSAQHEQNPDLAMCWSDVYIWMDEWEKKEKEDFFIRSFQDLLRHEGMHPSAVISHAAILYYFETKDFEKNIRELFSRVSNVAANVIAKIIPHSEMLFPKQDEWGRLGICSAQPWLPGIFIGVMLDGYDHAILHNLKFPEFVIIISFEFHLHGHYMNEPFYIKLVDELSSNYKLTEQGWNFYHHIKDEEIEVKNYWHPIYFRKPLLEVFRGTVTAKDQDEKVLDIIRLFLPIIWNSENFQGLRKVFSVSSIPADPPPPL
jgi:hypothetical protein